MADFVAIIATHGTDVLIASSGKWAQGASAVPNIFNAQRYPAGVDTPLDRGAAIVYFASFATLNNLNVGEITWKPADKHGVARYSTKYLLRDPPNPPGFVKGTVSPPSADRAFLRRKAIDEFREEIGIQLVDADLIATALPNVFVVDMTRKGAQDIAINAWSALGPVTEVVKLEWVPIVSLPRLNPQSESIRRLVPRPALPAAGPPPPAAAGAVGPGGRRPIRSLTSRKRRSRR